MAYLIAAIVITLIVLRGHSPIASFFKCNIYGTLHVNTNVWICGCRYCGCGNTRHEYVSVLAEASNDVPVVGDDNSLRPTVETSCVIDYWRCTGLQFHNTSSVVVSFGIWYCIHCCNYWLNYGNNICTHSHGHLLNQTRQHTSASVVVSQLDWYSVADRQNSCRLTLFSKALYSLPDIRISQSRKCVTAHFLL